MLKELERVLAWQYPGDDLLAKLALVADRDNTLSRLLWQHAIDGAVVLTPEEQAFLAPALDFAGTLRPWDRLIDHLVAAVNDPAIQADDEVYSLADLFVALAALAQKAGSRHIVARAMDLANSQRMARVNTRVSGEDTRARVKSAWQSDAAAGKPERGRAARIARTLHLPETTVKSAVQKLRKLGELPPA